MKNKPPYQYMTPLSALFTKIAIEAEKGNKQAQKIDQTLREWRKHQSIKH